MFEEYWFLWGLAFVWVVFAVVQDLRTREVSNWLNFSLIGFVLAYRAFYSIHIGDWMFFVYGLLGILFFVALAYGFYYGRVFAGGDAKLLMGLGGIFPYRSFFDIGFYGVVFIFVLFLLGAIYSLIYTLFLAFGTWNNFKKEFIKLFGKWRIYFFSGFILSVVFVTLGLVWREVNFVLFGGFVLLLPLIFVYSKAIEKCCMVKMVAVDKLREGDWLEKDVRINGKVIKKSVHGLSLEEIKLLKRGKKRVLIKEGVPFTPAFLFALVGIFGWLVWF